MPTQIFCFAAPLTLIYTERIFFDFIAGKEVEVSVDEEYTKVNFDKVKTLKPVFKKDGGEFHLEFCRCASELFRAGKFV